MKNIIYIYKVGGETFNLSQEQHENAQVAMREKMDTLSLDGGTRGMAVRNINSWYLSPDSVEVEARGRLGNAYVNAELAEAIRDVKLELQDKSDIKKLT